MKIIVNIYKMGQIKARVIRETIPDRHAVENRLFKLY